MFTAKCGVPAAVDGAGDSLMSESKKRHSSIQDEFSFKVCVG